MAEGYLEGRVGVGTTVASHAARRRSCTRSPEAAGRSARPARRACLAAARCSLRHARGASRAAPPRPARSGPACRRLDAVPVRALDAAPRRGAWRHADAAARSATATRPATRRCARRSRRISARRAACAASAEQVIVVAGAQQAVDLAARCCSIPATRPGSRTGLPRRARRARRRRRIRLVPGARRRRRARRRGRGARGARRPRWSTSRPSHQYPLGVTMSLARRLALLEWARAAGAWILEDDYDSEYRYAGGRSPRCRGSTRPGA